MGKRKGKHVKIEIRDTERSLYNASLKEKTNTLTNVLKILLMREDFYTFLDDYKNILVGNPFGIIVKKPSEFDRESGDKAIGVFVSKVNKTTYFSKLLTPERGNLTMVIKRLLEFYYPYKVFYKSSNALENEAPEIDKMLSFPSIHYHVMYEETYGKIVEILLSDPTPPVVSVEEDKTNKPRILQIICDESTGKQELMDYIDNFWEEMQVFLSSKKAKKSKDKRTRVSNKFLRDIDIYNSYVEIGGDFGVDNQESHVTRESLVVRELIGKYPRLTTDTVRKQVHKISKLREEINN